MEALEPPVRQDLLDLPVLGGFQEFLEAPAPLEVLVQLEQPGQLEMPVRLGGVEFPGQQVPLDLLVHWVLLALVEPAQVVQPDDQESLELQDNRVHKDIKAIQDHREFRDS